MLFPVLISDRSIGSLSERDHVQNTNSRRRRRHLGLDDQVAALAGDKQIRVGEANCHVEIVSQRRPSIRRYVGGAEEETTSATLN